MKYYCVISAYYKDNGELRWKDCNIITTNKKVANFILKHQRAIDKNLPKDRHPKYKIEKIEVKDLSNIESEILKAVPDMPTPFDTMIEPDVNIQFLLKKGKPTWHIHPVLVARNVNEIIYSTKTKPDDCESCINQINHVLKDYINLNLPVESYRKIL